MALKLFFTDKPLVPHLAGVLWLLSFMGTTQHSIFFYSDKSSQKHKCGACEILHFYPSKIESFLKSYKT